MLEYDCEKIGCKYREAFENKHTPMFIIDPVTGSIDDANYAACSYYGYSKEELLSINIKDINTSFRERIYEEMHKVKSRKKSWFRAKHILANGDIKNVEVYSGPIVHNNKELLFSVIHDIDEISKLERESLLNKVKLDYLFNKSLEAIAILDKKFKVVDINESFEKVFQYKPEEIEGQDLTEVVCNSSLFDESYGFRAELEKGKFVKAEVRRRRKDGSLVDVSLMLFPLVIEGETMGTYCIYADISEVKLKEKQIEDLINIDTLTTLYSREFFEQSIFKKILETKNKDIESFGIVVFGLNEYKEINKALGNKVGEEVLKEFSRILKTKTNEKNIAARIENDIFAAIIPEVRTMDRGTLADMAIKDNLNTKIIVEEYEIEVTTSVGISTYPDDSTDHIELIEKAVLAMNKSMEKSGEDVVKFESKIEEEVQKLFWFKHNLTKALANREFFLNFQPIIDSQSNKLLGTEALIRWNHKELGVVPPMKFIPLAEELGIIQSIDRWVLLNACKQNKIWQEMGQRSIYISVNISVLELEDIEFVDVVRGILAETGLGPKYLQIEITETAFSTKFESIKENIKGLQELGVKIAIDDFGTGHSSLEKLSELNINSLKIDRSFINEINENSIKNKIVKIIISLAETLKLDLIAEGVETEEQLNTLKSNKCTVAQGYFFSKPVGYKEIESYF